MTRTRVALLLALLLATVLILYATEDDRCTGEIRPNYMGGECIE